MQFDSNVAAQNEIKRTLSLDPRMVRYSVVKVADKMGKSALMEGIEGVDGSLKWDPADDLMRSVFDTIQPGRPSRQGLR